MQTVGGLLRKRKQSARSKIVVLVQMKEMMMRTGWMLMILLHCLPSHASKSQSTITYKEEKLQIFCMPATSHKPVFVPCPNVTAEEAMFHLFRDDKEVHNFKHNQTQNIQDCSQNHSSNGSLCKNGEDNSVGFNLIKEKNSSKEIYTCIAKVTFPPPYNEIQSDWKVVLVEEVTNICKIAERNVKRSKEESDGNQTFPWIWTVVVTLLSTYSLAVTITASVFWVKLRWTESQNDYMNAKPIVTGKRKKKKWAQNPIPRHF